MELTTDTDRAMDRSHGSDQRLKEVRSHIEHAAELLPAQGPIAVFVHHNPLHAMEDVSFDEAVLEAQRLLGCEPYLAEAQYRELVSRGRIRFEDLNAVLHEELGDEADALIGFLGTRYELRRTMLEHPLRSASRRELPWIMTETLALRRFWEECPRSTRFQMISDTRHWVMRDLRGPAGQSNEVAPLVRELSRRFGAGTLEGWNEAAWEACTLELLWQVCCEGVRHAAPLPAQRPPARIRDLIYRETGCDPDQLVHDVLIRCCAAFCDQGLAPVSLPNRADGFAAAFLSLYGPEAPLRPEWLYPIDWDAQSLMGGQEGIIRSIVASVAAFGVEADDEQEFITRSLLALRGWAGMIRQLEIRADRAVRPVPAGSLEEFLAVRLILDRLAAEFVLRQELGQSGTLTELRARLASARPAAEHDDAIAYQAFQLAQVMGWRPYTLKRLSSRAWRALVDELRTFGDVPRRRLYHLAYERRYRLATLEALAQHVRQRHHDRGGPPRLQVICCIDEREESFRRALEELSTEIETFGCAGFFGVAMYYRGAADAHFMPLCPVVIRPKHYVREEVTPQFAESERRRGLRRRALGTATHRVHLGSRGFWAGALAALAGTIASIPLVARVLFPHITARFRRGLDRFVAPPGATRLRLERTGSEPGPEPDACGYTVDEMADIVERLLRDIGLTRNFARLVVVMGHGSASYNNPHESAHDCGACGGGRGGPNARSWARMANDARVRQRLAARGLTIPADTRFLGGYHNTCDDNVEYFELDEVPPEHKRDLEFALAHLDEARKRNAHERCRRFETASFALTPQAALRHVEIRAEDLAQVRPEYGHATNAICVVGRRYRTRNLFMDRRAFLVSYDPTQDDQQCTLLTRILQAVVPVCAGINLEYYFSVTDSTGWGCGTKLPHNITALVGVMDGAASDLRPGLPWQMVEIHESVRLLFVIEATPEGMLSILQRERPIARLCEGGWVQLAVLSPGSSQIYVYRRGRFEPFREGASELPKAASSIDWYRNWRDHLDYAQIQAAGPPTNGQKDGR